LQVCSVGKGAKVYRDDDDDDENKGDGGVDRLRYSKPKAYIVDLIE
jgi:hypothetical protein